jgi:hypothetical protein
MIPVDLARALRTAGLVWEPESGDRFIIDMPDLADQTFVLSDLTVDVHHIQGQRVLGFNGTVEWALDSVTVEQALWLPHEHQLRAALGSAFNRLESLPDSRFRVVVVVDEAAIEFDDEDPGAAYGRALLNVLTR